MFSLRQVLVSIVLGAIVGVSAEAVTIYSDADYFGGLSPITSTPTGQSIGTGQSLSGKFNFVSADGTSSFSIGLPYGFPEWDTYESSLGFTPGSETIIPDSGFMKFFIREGILDFEIFTFSLADISFQSTVFTTAFTLSSGVTATVEGSINTFGEVAYTISSNGGSFIVDAAYMEFSAQPVPDGGVTVVLLGLSLAAIGVLRTKFGLGL